MPPVLIDGDLLFDGGSFNNFPVDQMRRLGARHIVGIDLLPDVVHKHELNNLPTTGGILRDKMRSRKAQRYRRLPSMPNTLLTASVITSMARQKKLRAHVDILFQPNTLGVSLLDWKKYDILFDRAKDDALRQLETIDETILNNFRQ